MTELEIHHWICEEAGDNLECPISFAATEIKRLKKQLAECDNHLRNVLIGASKVARPSYHDKAAFNRFMQWRNVDCQNAEKWRSFNLDNDKSERGA